MANRRRNTSATSSQPPADDILSGLTLPDPKPEGTKPFQVIDWLLTIGYHAACHVMEARHKRVEELGRPMRAESVRGEKVPHWEDDVKWRAVDVVYSRLVFERWWAAHRDARNLSAKFNIPFAEYDWVLKAAWDELNNRDRVIRGVACDDEVYPYTEFSGRLKELADSTTPSEANRATAPPTSDKPPATQRPKYDGETRRLTVGIAVKQYRTNATNAAAILERFESENWPDTIRHPIKGADSKTVNDHITALNRGLPKGFPIRFEGDGYGTGIKWRRVGEN